MGLLKVTVSGAYYSGAGSRGKEIVDFENVVGIIPEIDEGFIQQAVMWRMIQIWLSKDGKYPKRVDQIRHCYIDKVEKAEGKLGIIGKNIKDLSWEELQDLAVWKNLKIPEYRQTDLRFAREKAYVGYAALMGTIINPDAEDYNYASLPDLKIVDDGKVASPAQGRSNEEVIADAQKGEDEGDKTFDLKELKKIARAKKIKLPPNVTFDEAYRRVIVEGK